MHVCRKLEKLELIWYSDLFLYSCTLILNLFLPGQVRVCATFKINQKEHVFLMSNVMSSTICKLIHVSMGHVVS